jgi:hypothetical protein
MNYHANKINMGILTAGNSNGKSEGAFICDLRGLAPQEQ